MPESNAHKRLANLLAKKYKTDYNKGKGADIRTDNIAIEVETPTTVKGGLKQLGGHQKRVYIAGTNEEAVQKALEQTRGTTIGVMDNKGNIRKRSTRS